MHRRHRQHHRISIHALREEGDVTDDGMVTIDAYFYPRPPRGGRRLSWLTGEPIKEFLSTPSARRATQGLYCQGHDRTISIHALREEGDKTVDNRHKALEISIHALREEGDDAPRHYPSTTYQFLSTPSARRATSAASPVAD